MKTQNNKIWQDRLYLILAGIFISSLVSCNLIFQKFFQIDLWLPFFGYYTFEQSVGLLPYPVTFLVTDIISEIYGKKKANQVVISGLIASIFMLVIISVCLSLCFPYYSCLLTCSFICFCFAHFACYLAFVLFV